MSKNLLRKLGVKRSILNEKELVRPIDVQDMLADEKFPHPSLVNTTTDNLRRVLTEHALERVTLMSKLTCFMLFLSIVGLAAIFA